MKVGGGTSCTLLSCFGGRSLKPRPRERGHSCLFLLLCRGGDTVAAQTALTQFPHSPLGNADGRPCGEGPENCLLRGEALITPSLSPPPVGTTVDNLSTRGKAGSQPPTPPPWMGLPELGRGAWAEQSVLGERLPAPTLRPHTMAAFSPVTFPQPELYAAVSSPSPKRPGVGGISAALEKDPRSSQPSLVPLLACKAHFLRS